MNSSNAAAFSFDEDPIALPKGAWAATERQTLRLKDRPVLSLTQGKHRSYIFPLYTPAGFLVTTEAPADHPHHSSCWVAADHVHCKMPAAAGRFEDYTYNFYLNETFQGRAPGTILQTGVKGRPTGGESFEITQQLEWRGPIEWAAPSGRIALKETRTTHIALDGSAYVIDIATALSAGDWDFTIGPTRHALFNVRLAEGIAATSGGAVRDDRGKTGSAITGEGARWIDYSGPVGGGNSAGITVFAAPRTAQDETWFVTDWGVVTVGPFRNRACEVRKGETATLRYRILVHDGVMDDAAIEKHYAAYARVLG
ncbi:MAG: PmoA family protein [Parvibaculaceae bacterium]